MRIPQLRGFFAQWLNSTGVPDFAIEYVVYRTKQGFRVVGKIKQPLDTFSMPVDIRIETEGNPETKTVDVIRHRVILHRRDLRTPQTGRHQDRSQ